MKTAKIFWSSSAVLINIVIAIYIYLQQKGPATTLAAQFEYIIENWSLYGGHWKAEFLLMTMMLIGAAYFMLQFKNISWTIITIGRLRKHRLRGSEHGKSSGHGNLHFWQPGVLLGYT